MASTAKQATPHNPVGVAYSGGLRMTTGVATLSSGTVELDTGLSEVYGFVATECSGAATEAVVLSVYEDLPTTTGTITVDGVKLDEGQAVANSNAQQFSWIAWGR
jgi:X-X-X-Leu-X-X-Gly heptad repeat protein